MTETSVRRRPLQAMIDLLMLMAGQVSSKVVGFIAFAYMARVLSPHDYGAVEIAVGMAAIGLACVEFGIGTMGTRRIAQKEASVATVVSHVVSARTLLCLMVLPVLSLTYIALTQATVPPALILVFAGSVMFGVFKHDWLFQALEKMHLAAFGFSLKMLVFFVALLILRPGEHGVLTVAFAEVIGMAAMAVFFLTAQFASLGWIRPRLSVRAGWSLMMTSAPLGFSAMINTLAAAVPVLIVASVASTTDAGQFGAALRIAVSLQAFSWMYYFNLFPLISKCLHSDTARLAELIGASETFLAWGGIAGAALISAVAGPIMAVVFGSDFAGAGIYLAILIWAVPLSLASGTGRWLLIAQDEQKQVFTIQLIALLAGLCVTLLSVPLVGPVGAAIGFIVTGVASWVLAHHAARRGAVAPRLAPFVLPGLLAALMFIAFALFSLSPVMKAGTVIVVMTVGAFLGSPFLKSCRILAKSKAVENSI